MGAYFWFAANWVRYVLICWRLFNFFFDTGSENLHYYNNITRLWHSSNPGPVISQIIQDWKIWHVQFNISHYNYYYYYYCDTKIHEFLPQSATVNEEYYMGIVCHLCETICRIWSDLWKNNWWKLHYDNAHTHTWLLI